MTTDDFIKAQIALVAWLGGHAGGPNAMLGIAFLIKRTADECNGDWKEAIEFHHPGEKDNGSYQLPDIRDPEFTAFLRTVDSVYNGSREDKITNRATHYVVSENKDNWFPTHSLFERTAKVGPVEFYRYRGHNGDQSS